MGAYGFEEMFEPPILSGLKRHTIRAERRYPDKPGSTMSLYIGLRTKRCRLIFRAPCVKVESIAIVVRTADCHKVRIEGTELTRAECEALALLDGFSPREGLTAFAVMCRYWIRRHGAGLFVGHIYHWDYERREGRK